MKLIFNTLLFFLIGFCSKNVAAQNWVSVKSFDSMDEINPINPSLIFPSSSDYLTYSSFDDTLVIEDDTIIAQNYSDLVIRRLNNNNEIKWTQVIQCEGYEYITNVQIDATGNVYVLGYFEGIKLDAGDTSILNVGKSDGYLAKYDQNGNLLWLKSISSTTSDFINGLKVNSNNEIFILGNSTDYETSTSILFLIKMSEFGGVLNIYTSKTTSNSYYFDFNFKENNDIEITGVLKGNLVLNNNEILESINGNAIFKIFIDDDLNYKSVIKSKDYPYFDFYQIIKNNIFINVYDMYVYDEENFDWVYHNTIYRLDENLNEKWKYILNEKVLVSSNFENEQLGDAIQSLNIDNEGNTILGIGSISSRFICNNDTAYYKVYKDYDDVTIMENYIVALDTNGNEFMFYNFNTDLASSTISIDILENGNILLTGNYQDSILNIGDFQLYNNNELFDYYGWIHNIHFVFRDDKYFQAEFNFSSTTGLISNQISSLPSKLYPNPTNNFIKIKFEQPLKANSKLIVFSIDGKLMTKQYFPSGSSEIQLDVSNFSKGVYLACVHSGEESVVHKFLKD